jgi:gliding motility-associated-like protein
MIPRGYRYSARLGDEINNGDPGSFRCWNQSLRYTMTVDSANALLLLKFAVVLQYADNHTDKMEPRFHLQLYDQEGDSLADCANYDVFATATNAKGFRSYQPANGSDPVRWRDWTTVGVNLSSQIGRQVTIEFMSADCTGNFHYGYAYFVAACHPLSITVKYCAGDSVAALSAPEGFEKYSWTDSGGNPISSARILTLDDPQEGSLYTCDMTSATGCTVSLQSTIARYVLNIGFESHMLDCKSNTVQFTNSTTTNKGSLSYWWDFGDGNGSSEINPKYTFSTSGFHRVGLAVENPPSECGDTLWKTIESFSPPLVGIAGDTTYCPGGVAWLKAYGAADYTWSTGSKADSIPAADPNITYWLIGRSTTGCVSDTIRRAVKPEPPWSLISTGDTILCTGSSTLLSVSGAVSYSWDTGETGDSVVVSLPGTYTVTGTNARGCEKPMRITVAEHGLPSARISLSVPVIDSKHSQLTLSAPGDPGVLYGWDLGDGTPGSGTTFIHSYTVDPLTAAYTIVLTATSAVGCQASDSTTVDVIPFIPNVFSPNGDGINDLFMEGLQAEVFDRNGMKLYSGTTGWDGRFNGRPLDPDTYFYLLQYTNRLGEVKSRKGFITLTR